MAPIVDPAVQSAYSALQAQFLARDAWCLHEFRSLAARMLTSDFVAATRERNGPSSFSFQPAYALFIYSASDRALRKDYREWRRMCPTHAPQVEFQMPDGNATVVEQEKDSARVVVRHIDVSLKGVVAAFCGLFATPSAPSTGGPK